MKKQIKYYAVWNGRETGVFNSWKDCKVQIDGYPNSGFKSYPTEREAKNAIDRRRPDFLKEHTVQIKNASLKAIPNFKIPQEKPNQKCIVVDGACNVSNRRFEFRAINLGTGEEIFHYGPIANGSNNIAEFLAVVAALKFCKEQQINYTVYSDSITALAWTRNKKAKTSVPRTNEALFSQLERAEQWLHDNPLHYVVLKWETKLWGENPADFGRK